MRTTIEPRRTDESMWDGCLVGTLETWPLSDIILWLHQSQRTGMLRLGTGLDAGVLFFRDGWLYRCEWGQLIGEQALFALLDLKRGSFSLMQREPPDARPNIQRPTAELLFNLTVALDEQRRAGSA